MPFGLNNAIVTYQRAMNLIFHYFIVNIVEVVYIDDVVVKSFLRVICLISRQCLSARTRLEDEPVKMRNFLKFLVHNRGVEIDKKKSGQKLKNASHTDGQQRRPSKADSGSFICRSPPQARDCPMKEKLAGCRGQEGRSGVE